jgi:hypothetical protein
VAFGLTDGVPAGVTTVDINPSNNPTYVADWKCLPFEDQQFEFGFIDPPYYRLDKTGKATLKPCLFKKECVEAWRCCRRLAILHNFVYPRSWFEGARREAMVCVTMGPLKATRMLNVFIRPE